MPSRKIPLVNGQYYHIYSRSIAKYVVFNNEDEYARFLELINLCRHENFTYKYSQFLELESLSQKTILKHLEEENSLLVEIVAYCIMPTHIHLLLKQVKDNGIVKFMLRVMSSYSRYFNQKHHRNGPLWTGRFKDVLVETDEQLLHLTRYIHLNPSSAGIVEDPFMWHFSSLKEYTVPSDGDFCNFQQIIDMSPQGYKKFVLDQKSYQRDLAIIKNTIIDDYSG
jgi:putative transposase